MSVLDEGPLDRPGRPVGGYVSVVRSSKAERERLTALAPLRLVPATEVPTDVETVLASPSVRHQKFLGFGGAFTESSAEVFAMATPWQKARILDAYFGEETGLGYQFGRLHMNSCDFSRGNWSCCDTEGDVELKSFSIDRYRDAILPMIRQAAAAAGSPLRLLASPWSPPAWMKSDGKMRGGSLRKEYRSVWAQFFVLFADHFRREGLPLWGMTVQNEPEAATTWETCFFSDTQERDFVRDHLGPALGEAGLLDLKLIVWDHNRDHMYNRATAIYGDPAAARFVWGLGFHWYEGNFANVQRVHQLRPDKHLIFTEGCQEGGPHIGSWLCGERYGKNIIMDLNHWTEAWIDWNLVLNEHGGPNHAGNMCSAPIMVDFGKGRLMFQPSYYVLGHFSRYLRPGAMHITCKSSCKGLPDKLSLSLLTRVRRNLESMIADEDKTKLNDAMLELRSAIEEHREEDLRLQGVRALLTAVKLPSQLQDRFLLEIVEGRFGIDWQRHVPGGGRQQRAPPGPA